MIGYIPSINSVVLKVLDSHSVNSGKSGGIPVLISSKYHIDVHQRLGKGSFGYVFGAYDVHGNKYAAKFEIKGKNSLLPYEYKILMHFQNEIGFPKVYLFKEQGGYYIMIMELLGIFIFIFFYFV
jgi:predicted Ser/Thr protein kinase